MAEPAAPVRNSDNGHIPEASDVLLGPATTETVETEGAVVEEEADVACTRRHAAEGVGTAGRQGVNATGEQENDQRPGEGVLPCCLNQHHCHQFPQEIPAGKRSTEGLQRNSLHSQHINKAEPVTTCFCVDHCFVNLLLLGCFIWSSIVLLHEPLKAAGISDLLQKNGPIYKCLND